MEILDGRYYGNGDKNLYLKITGEGKIPVVIEPSWGSLSFEWEAIQIELSKHTTVISYDRAGYGESPKGVIPRTSGQIADELYIALKNTGIEGPFILIGHGSGGLYCQNFLKLFANEVAGLVLVDSMSVKDMEFDNLKLPKYQETMTHKIKIENFKRYSEMEEEEFNATVLPMLNKIYGSFPEEMRDILITYQSDINFYKTTLAELEARDASIEMLNQLSLFTNIPITILCSDYKVMVDYAVKSGIPEEEARVVQEYWLKSTKELENLSTDTEIIIVKNSSHYIHYDNPKAIIDTTLNMIKKCNLE